MGLGRETLADPDRPAPYALAQFWAPPWREWEDCVLVPMDSRCTAAPNGVTDYAFYRTGGLSWAVPWVAGLYALACQVRPDITWDRCWSAVESTTDEAKAVLDGSEQVFERIVNPERLLAAIR